MPKKKNPPPEKAADVRVPDALKPMLQTLHAIWLSKRNVRRKHDVDRIAKSLLDHGWHSVIVAGPDGEVLVGNGRWKAARKLGLKEVPVLSVPDEGVEAVNRMIADNRSAELSEWNVDHLVDIIRDYGVEIVREQHIEDIVGDALKDLDEIVGQVNLTSDPFAAGASTEPEKKGPFGRGESTDYRQDEKVFFFEVSVPKSDKKAVSSALTKLREEVPSVTVRQVS